MAEDNCQLVKWFLLLLVKFRSAVELLRVTSGVIMFLQDWAEKESWFSSTLLHLFWVLCQTKSGEGRRPGLWHIFSWFTKNEVLEYHNSQVGVYPKISYLSLRIVQSSPPRQASINMYKYLLSLNVLYSLLFVNKKNTTKSEGIFSDKSYLGDTSHFLSAKHLIFSL